jgi:hypothetical protein
VIAWSFSGMDDQIAAFHAAFENLRKVIDSNLSVIDTVVMCRTKAGVDVISAYRLLNLPQIP